MKTSITLCLAVLLALPAGGAWTQESGGEASIRLTVHLVHGTDQGSGAKFDKGTKKLKAALDKINRSHFWSLREFTEPMLFGEAVTFGLVADQLTVTVSPKAGDKYPLDLDWKKSDGSPHVKMKVHLAPKKLFALQGTPYQQGNLWAVLEVEEGSFPLETEEGPSKSPPVPPRQDPVKTGESGR